MAAVLAFGPAWAGDSVPDDVMQRFNEAALRAETAQKGAGVEAAIRIYEQLILDGDDYGRVHLRLGQLYQDSGRAGEAAHHFQLCMDDTRVDPVDRDLICKGGFDASTAELTLVDPPQGATVTLVAPELTPFVGEMRSGTRVPLGAVEVVVSAPGRVDHRETLQVAGPLSWTPPLGAPLGAVAAAPNDGIAIPEDFVSDDVEAPPEESNAGVGRWPAWVTVGVGAALVAGGTTLGFLNRSELDNIRSRQSSGACGAGRCSGELTDAENMATTADALWISGAAITAVGAGLFFVFDGGE